MLKTVEVDERTWSEASDARRLEWENIIREMTTPGEMVLRDDAARMHATLTQQGTELVLYDLSDGELARVLLPHDLLGDLITEYIDIVREIAKASARGSIKRLEALDMAKKATHDRAASKIERRLRSFELDHPSARRIFTLLLALKVDTTRIMGVHSHRRVK